MEKGCDILIKREGPKTISEELFCDGCKYLEYTGDYVNYSSRPSCSQYSCAHNKKRIIGYSSNTPYWCPLKESEENKS